MNGNGDSDLFDAWFEPWKAARPDGMPIGMYSRADLRAAFEAGAAADFQRGLAEIIKRIREAVDDL